MRYMSILCITFLFLIGCAPTNNIQKINYYRYHDKIATSNINYKTFPVYVDKEFSKEEMTSLYRSISEWNRALNGYFKIQIVDMFDNSNYEQTTSISNKIQATDEGIMIYCISENNPLIKNQVFDKNGNRDDKLAFVNDLGDDGHTMIIIQDRIGHRNLHKIFLHEFGHIFGARHVEAFSLMHTRYGSEQTDCIDKITIAQVAAYNGLDLSKLDYCALPNFE